MDKTGTQQFKPMTRAHQIQALLCLLEAVIFLPPETQQQIRTVVAVFFKILKAWFIRLDQNGTQVDQIINTRPLVRDLNEFVQNDAGERIVTFYQDDEDDTPSDNLLLSADYGFSSDNIVGIYIVQNYRYPGPRPPNFLFMDYMQLLKRILDHEFIHQQQALRRAAHTTQPVPYFGSDAYNNVRRDREQLRKHREDPAHNPPFNADPRFTVRPALTLTRKSMFTPDPSAFPRDTLHARHDPQRVKGQEDPRHRTGLHDYLGHPEEIMAHAGSFARSVLDAHRRYPKDWANFASADATSTFIDIQRGLGENSPAFRRWIKYVKSYLAPHFSTEQIERILRSLALQARTGQQP